jgi:hypothetical protein
LTGEVAGQPLDVFLAGEDGEAKVAAQLLVEDGGVRAIDVGFAGAGAGAGGARLPAHGRPGAARDRVRVRGEAHRVMTGTVMSR